MFPRFAWYGSLRNNLEKLKVFNVLCLNHNADWKKLYQAIISSAPNLENLMIHDSSLEMKLPANCSLKIFYFVPMKEINPENLYNWLKACSNTLEEFILSSGKYRSKDLCIFLPRMPNLRKLTLEKYLDAHNFPNLTSQLVPKLSFLSINENMMATQVQNIEDLEINSISLLNSRFDNLKSLVINNLSNPSNLFRLGEHCPNLEYLKLAISYEFKQMLLPDFNEEYTASYLRERQLFKDIFELTKILSIKHFTIVIGISYDIKDLILALEPHFFQLFYGLETLRIENEDLDDEFQGYDSLSERLPRDEYARDCLRLFKLILRTIKMTEARDVYFHNFQFNAATSVDVIKTVLEYKIPVHFTSSILEGPKIEKTVAMVAF